jgi:hypothetical protein
VIVRDTSVAVSMARSAMPGWIVDSGVSIFTIRCSRSYDAGSAAPRVKRDEAAAFGYPLQAPSLNGGWRPRIRKCGDENFVPSELCIGVQISRESPESSPGRRAEGFFSVFCRAFARII